jgi:hypothetical protein
LLLKPLRLELLLQLKLKRSTYLAVAPLMMGLQQQG